MTKKTYFTYYWYLYLIIIALIVGIWQAIFYLDSLPKKDRTITLFICSNNVNSTQLSSYLTKCYENSSDYDYVAVDHTSIDHMYTSSIFQTRGLISSDCMLLPKGFISESNYPRYFKELDTISLNLAYGPFIYEKHEDKNYGINIKSTAFCSKYVDINDDYYLYFLNRDYKDGIYKIIDYLVGNYE